VSGQHVKVVALTHHLKNPTSNNDGLAKVGFFFSLAAQATSTMTSHNRNSWLAISGDLSPRLAASFKSYFPILSSRTPREASGTKFSPISSDCVFVCHPRTNVCICVIQERLTKITCILWTSRMHSYHAVHLDHGAWLTGVIVV
jgi:hypothetical protein